MNSYLETLVAGGRWVITANLQATLLILVVATLTFAGRRYFTPQWRSVLWMLVFLRLLLPTGPETRLSVYNLLPIRDEGSSPAARDHAVPRPVTAARARISSERPADPPLAASPAAAAAPAVSTYQALMANWPTVLSAVWLSVALVLLARLGHRSGAMSWQLSALPVLDDAGLQQLVRRCAEELRLRRVPPVLAAPSGTGPAVSGLFRPRLLLPAEFATQFSKEQLRLIVLHELRHLRSGDLLVSWGLQVIAAIHWFNPFVWWARSCWLAERELACDAWVLSHVGFDSVRTYGGTLLQVVTASGRSKPLLLAAQISAFPSLIERRIRAMKTARFQQARRNQILGAFATALLAFIGLTGPVGAENESEPAADTTMETGFDNLPAESRSPEPTVIFTKHLILWDYASVTWDEVLQRMRERRKQGPFPATFLFTNGSPGYREWNQKIFEVYSELFEPVGITIGSISPRESRRLDQFETADDLAPDPALRRTGKVVVGGSGEPADGAKVVILPVSDPLPVALEGTDLRDPYDEQWAATNEQGEYAVYPDREEYLVAVLHPSGFRFFRGPLENGQTITLEPWATITFTTTGEAEGQRGSVSARPRGSDEHNPGFTVYEIETKGEPLTVPVPPGRVTVMRSLKAQDGGSVASPLETFTLEPGVNRTASIPAATPEEREEAKNVFQGFRN